MIRRAILILLWCLTVLYPAVSWAQNRQRLGEITAREIDEASGIAASRAHPGIFWVHNDSGDVPRIFAIGRDGSLKKILHMPGAKARDWEDIAIGPGPVDGQDYLYVADIGDNLKRYIVSMVYRFEEPSPDGEIGHVDEIRFEYPDKRHNAEALMVDPLTKDIYIVTKERAHAFVYRLAYPQATDRVIRAELVADVGLTGVVAGDISADGQKILLKIGSRIFHWERTSSSEPLTEVFKRAPGEWPYVKNPMEEGACFDPSGHGYYTVGEKGDGPVYLYYYPLD